MPSAEYAPLPNPRSVPDVEREMHEAFQLDDEDDDNHTESTPLTHGYHDLRGERPQISITTPATYDFERDYDYDYPPPGSPPDPSAARPNDYGNSNGVIPSSPERPEPGRPSLFRRVVGALLPQHYQRLPSDAASHRAVGGGMENDGVFGNVMAKPGRTVEVVNEDGSVYMVPEEVQNQAPPVSTPRWRPTLYADACTKTYNEAQADAVPPYWETTITSSLDPNADMIVDDLPTGSWYLFAANVFISYFFQFIGFLFTYLLHTTHAAKFGSRVGLGLTLIQFGFQSRRRTDDDLSEIASGSSWNATMAQTGADGEYHAIATTTLPNGTVIEVPLESLDLTSRDWVSFLLMTLGK